MDSQEQTWPSQATVDAYATLGAEWDKRDSNLATIVLNNTGANGATYTLQGSVNGTTWVTAVAEANLAAGVSVALTTTAYWPRLRIRVKAQVAASQTTLTAAGAAPGV